MLRPTIILFAKEPRLGRVKRRLARDIGAGPALRFYRRNLDSVVRRLARDGRFDVTVAITPDRAARNVFPHRLIPQGDGNLGARMVRALKQARPGPVVIVGSDIPAIDATVVQRALALLGCADAVFGPSGDGGYWLVGLKRVRPVPFGLFDNVRWSSPHALSDSRASLPGGYKVALADRLDDVDDGSAWHRWKREAADGK